MKQQILSRYTELCDKSHFKFLPQIRTYLETEKEEDEETGLEVVDVPYPGNTTYNFNSRITDKDIQPISIAYMTNVSHIFVLDLSYNVLSDKGASVLSKLIEYAENIKKINLKGNRITDTGCENLNKGLLNKKKLEYLNMNSNRFGNVGLLSINELLFKNDALKFLDVGGNRYDWDGIISLMNALKTTNKSLEVLNMDEPAYKISDQHFFNHVGKMFLSNTNLKKLSLKFNKLRWEGLNIIIFSLSRNTTLTVLDLTGNQICFQGMIYVRDYLKDNNILKSLILCGNKLRDQGAKVLVDGLVPNKTLVHLDITNNDIGEQGFIDFGNKIKENTGIKNLRIKYSNVFGYSFEITNSFKDKVPDYFIRKQTLTNCERYTTPKLKELEDTILNAQDKLNNLEYDMFCKIRDSIALEIGRIQSTAKAIALLDVYASLAYVAEKNRYVKPNLNDKGVINIKNGRHPVVEKMLDSSEMFISNDTYLDNKKHCISIITGPNMAGKSTYMRQTALIVLMAQIGAFVPADIADICVVDRIFTRVGASDDLGSGQSTFMVEMNEVANILRNATPDSLLILDEIGRGTSTYDGLAIAWAVTEHISNRKILGAKTLFATHYHELTELEGKMDNVNNYCIAVKENGDDIVFLRKIIKGGADKSYGIQVAKLAGVPDMVIDRAKEIVAELTDNDITEKVQNIAKESKNDKKVKVQHYDDVDIDQMTLFDTVTDEDVLKRLQEIDITTLTPMDALNTLYKLQSDLKNRWKN